ncbi:MAG: hypothetical protein K2L33_01405, partial [Muribaculaceae bacterium]|nr:hypothetical protein [Muribaculaceae bacterium]
MEDNDIRQTQAVMPTDEPELTLTDLYRQMRSKWIWYVVSVGICLAVACLYLLAATPSYTRTTEILLKDDSSQSVAADLSMLGINPVSSEVLNEMFIMTSPEIMEQVVKQLDLNEVYTTRKGLRKQDLYKASPVDVVTIDSLTNRNSSYAFTIAINDEKTGYSLSKFKKAGKKVKSDHIEASFNDTVITPVGSFVI